MKRQQQKSQQSKQSFFQSLDAMGIPTVKKGDLPTTDSTLSEQPKSKDYNRTQNKSSRQLDSISEEFSGFAQFKIHQNEAIIQSSRYDITKQEQQKAKINFKKNHGRHFGRTDTLDETILYVKERNKLKMVAVLLILGLIVFIIMFSLRSQAPNTYKRRQKRQRKSKKSRKVQN